MDSWAPVDIWQMGTIYLASFPWHQRPQASWYPTLTTAPWKSSSVSKSMSQEHLAPILLKVLELLEECDRGPHIAPWQRLGRGTKLCESQRSPGPIHYDPVASRPQRTHWRQQGRSEVCLGVGRWTCWPRAKESSTVRTKWSSLGYRNNCHKNWSWFPNKAKSGQFQLKLPKLPGPWLRATAQAEDSCMGSVSSQGFTIQPSARMLFMGNKIRIKNLWSHKVIRRILCSRNKNWTLEMFHPQFHHPLSVDILFPLQSCTCYMLCVLGQVEWLHCGTSGIYKYKRHYLGAAYAVCISMGGMTAS